MQNGIKFFTATCLNWQNLLEPDEHKEIIVNSLRFLVENGRIWLYAFVIMPNHIHLLWCKQDEWIEKNVQQMFLKYTAQQIKFNLLEWNPNELKKYVSTQDDRDYHFWERRAFSSTMYNRKVASQKIDYIHYNPVKKGLCSDPVDYKYSSARFYELNNDEWGSITHFADHL
ncbi:MAG: transposase [Flammeovirgaceae bacterium]|nr:transposase [Flammeovirgaceae bacterium]